LPTSDATPRSTSHAIFWTVGRIEGHQWGEFNNDFASKHQHHFTRILAADCYRMPGQHENLVQSMLHFLHPSPESRIFAIAGFHTGRAKLGAFFDVAVEQGLEVEEIHEEDAEGRRRAWLKERDYREGGSYGEEEVACYREAEAKGQGLRLMTRENQTR
jgi:hypothetical protein